jgi:hypothetical protein
MLELEAFSILYMPLNVHERAEKWGEERCAFVIVRFSCESTYFGWLLFYILLALGGLRVALKGLWTTNTLHND